MGLFKKLGDMVRSNASAAINAAEDPRKLLDQAVADLQEQIKAAQKQRLDVATLAKVSEKQALNHRAKSDEWEKKATAALRSGNEELARAALTEKATVDGLLAEAESTMLAQRKMVDDISASIVQLEGGLETARKKRTELMMRLQKAEAAQRQNEAKGIPSKDHIGDTSAFDTFDRMTEKIEMNEAVVEAQSEMAALDGKAPVPIDTSRQLTAATADDALAALKAKMGKG